MKEQVTDISKVLQAMTEEMRLLRATVNQQYAEIIKLNRNINALNLEIRKKDTELIKLRERLAKYEKPDKNSNNKQYSAKQGAYKGWGYQKNKKSA